jgi:hypothetical protein
MQVLVEPHVGYPELYGLPVAINGDFNIPNATVGHNLEHGTSVYAAARVPLELLRIVLARAGLKRRELDRLSLSDVSLHGVTLTYLMPFADDASAARLVQDIREQAKALGVYRHGFDSTNFTVYIDGPDFSIRVYVKTDLKQCRFAADAPKAAMAAAARAIVRIEVNLGEPFLRDEGLVAPRRWRNAHATGLYNSLFNKTVRKVLHLDGPMLRNKTPRAEVYAKLTETEALLLRGYLQGRDPRHFHRVKQSKWPDKRLSQFRVAIRDKARIDIALKWSAHTKLRCRELAKKLRCPPDYAPPEERASWCFCKDNWRSLLKRMRDAYVLWLAASKQARKPSPASHRVSRGASNDERR